MAKFCRINNNNNNKVSLFILNVTFTKFITFLAQWLNALAFSLSVPSMVGSSPTDCEIISNCKLSPRSGSESTINCRASSP